MNDPHSEARPLALDAVIVMLSPTKGELWTEADRVVAAALLVDLTRQGRLLVSGSGQDLQVAVQDATPVGDDLLDAALQAVASHERTGRVTKLLGVLPSSDQVLDRLVTEGKVTVETGRKFGMLKVRRHHPTPAAARDALTARLQGVLLEGAEPDARTAALLSVLAIDRRLRAGVPEGQRPDVYRRVLSVRESTGQDEAAVVSTIDELVRRANNSARNSSLT